MLNELASSPPNDGHHIYSFIPHKELNIEGTSILPNVLMFSASFLPLYEWKYENTYIEVFIKIIWNNIFQELRSQCFLFLMAGYETTATTLIYTAYELAYNQEIQSKLYDEITECFPNKVFF